MSTNIIIMIINIIIYIFSTIASYKFIQKAHYHPDGRWTSTHPSKSDRITIFLPVINILIAIDYLTGGWKREGVKNKTEFFKQKN